MRKATDETSDNSYINGMSQIDVESTLSNTFSFPCKHCHGGFNIHNISLVIIGSLLNVTQTMKGMMLCVLNTCFPAKHIDPVCVGCQA